MFATHQAMNLLGLCQAWGQIFWRASWQGAIFIALIAILCRFVPRLPASTRCILWLLGCTRLLLGLIWTAPVTLRLPVPPPTSFATKPLSYRAIVQSGAAGESKAADVQNNALDTNARRLRQNQALSLSSQHALSLTQPDGHSSSSFEAGAVVALAFLWLAGAMWRLIGSLLAWRQAARLLNAAHVEDSSARLALLQAIAGDMKMRVVPSLLITPAETGPLVISHWHNVVLMTQSHLESLDAEELRAVLAHEFAHIQRGDLWLGLVPLVTQIFFWFHPLAWLACREFALCREAACDALAVSATHTTTQRYSQLLLKLGAQYVTLGPAAALGATSDFRALQRRILMLHQLPTRVGTRFGGVIAACWAGLVGLGMVPWQLVSAQEPVSATAKPVQDQARKSDNANPEKWYSRLPGKPSNLDFAQGIGGWNRSTHDGEDNLFDGGLDENTRYQGTASPFLYATSPKRGIYGVLTQWINAEAYRGKRVRFGGWFKTQGVSEYAGPMLGLVGGDNARTFTRAKAPIKSDTDWTYYEYVTDVGAETEAFVLGMNLQGRGKVWMNRLTWEVVDKTVPVSPDRLTASQDDNQSRKLPAQPVNMNFSQGVNGWFHIEEGTEDTPAAYRAGTERTLRPDGKNAKTVFLTSDGSQPNGYGTLVQYINPEAYRGKRIRLTGLIRTVGVKKFAGLWIGQSAPEWKVWDAEHAPVKAPTRWTEVSLVCDVPKSCAQLGLGLVVRGVGKLYVDHLTLKIVGDDVPTSPLTYPAN